MRAKYKQNWINHLQRMDNTRLPKHALKYKHREEEILDAPVNDGNVSLPEKVKRPNPWRKMMMMMMGFLVNKKKALNFKLWADKEIFRTMIS